MTSDLATLTPITRTHQTAKPSPDKCWKPESATVVKMLPSVLTNGKLSNFSLSIYLVPESYYIKHFNCTIFLQRDVLSWLYMAKIIKMTVFTVKQTQRTSLRQVSIVKLCMQRSPGSNLTSTLGVIRYSTLSVALFIPSANAKVSHHTNSHIYTFLYASYTDVLTHYIHHCFSILGSPKKLRIWFVGSCYYTASRCWIHNSCTYFNILTQF